MICAAEPRNPFDHASGAGFSEETNS